MYKKLLFFTLISSYLLMSSANAQNTDSFCPDIFPTVTQVLHPVPNNSPGKVKCSRIGEVASQAERDDLVNQGQLVCIVEKRGLFTVRRDDVDSAGNRGFFLTMNCRFSADTKSKVVCPFSFEQVFRNNEKLICEASVLGFAAEEVQDLLDERKELCLAIDANASFDSDDLTSIIGSSGGVSFEVKATCEISPLVERSVFCPSTGLLSYREVGRSKEILRCISGTNAVDRSLAERIISLLDDLCLSVPNASFSACDIEENDSSGIPMFSAAANCNIGIGRKLPAIPAIILLLGEESSEPLN